MHLLRTTLVVAIATSTVSSQGLLEARAGFETKLTRQVTDDEELPEPPGRLFERVTYKGPAGRLSALLGQRPEDSAEGQRHPAVLWITGGFPQGGIGPSAWTEDESLENDQSAVQWRLAGFVMMYPTLRGSFGNDGQQEGFYGEVDDVIAALDYARTIDWIDPERIYLGGHSTGGTLALLVGAATKGFRGIVSFGPIGDPKYYGAELAFHDLRNKQENELRAPIRHLGAIQTPTLVIEGKYGNPLASLERASKNDKLRFITVPDADHYEILAPLNRMLAAAMIEQPDLGKITLETKAIVRAIEDQRLALVETSDLYEIAAARSRGIDIRVEHTLRFAIRLWDQDDLKGITRDVRRIAKDLGIEMQDSASGIDEDGDRYWEVVATKKLVPLKLDAVSKVSAPLTKIANEADATYWGWSVQR